MTRLSDPHSEIDRLVVSLDTVEDALAAHLSSAHGLGSDSRAGRALLPPLEFVRFQIKAWCAAAARRGHYDSEALAVTVMAIDTMDKSELAEMLHRLLQRAGDKATEPAA